MTDHVAITERSGSRHEPITPSRAYPRDRGSDRIGSNPKGNPQKRVASPSLYAATGLDRTGFGEGKVA